MHCEVDERMNGVAMGPSWPKALKGLGEQLQGVENKLRLSDERISGVGMGS